MSRFIGLIGIVVIFLICYALSNNKKAINYKTIGTGFLLQIAFAIFIFKVPLGQKMFLLIGEFIRKILEFAYQGGSFVFGALLENDTLIKLFGQSSTIFAIQLICSNIFMMVLVNILYHYGIMQKVVATLGKAMNKLMRVSGAEALSNVASAFVGQIVAQIMIKPYLEKLTRSELLASMAGSMACISGAIMPIYIGMGIPAQYLLASSVMAAPGALILAKIIYPETGEPETRDNIKISRRKNYTNVFDAIANGASDGMKVALNVSAMIIALIALVAFIDWTLNLAGNFLFQIPCFAKFTFSLITWLYIRKDFCNFCFDNRSSTKRRFYCRLAYGNKNRFKRNGRLCSTCEFSRYYFSKKFYDSIFCSLLFWEFWFNCNSNRWYRRISS